MQSFRIATWNTKQGVAPRQKEPVLWEWILKTIKADVVVLTEAKAPKQGFPLGWNAVWVPGGVGKNRPWGTIIAAKDLELKKCEFKRRRSKREEDQANPVTSFAVEVLRAGKTLVRVYGHYGLMLNDMNGHDALHGAECEIEDLIHEHGSEKIICAGDFNLWPSDITGWFEKIGMVSVTDLRNSFPNLRDPVAGSRIWTHKNGPKASDGMRQELDFIFLSKDLVKHVKGTKGGVGDFSDSWEMSDHAPVSVDLAI